MDIKAFCLLITLCLGIQRSTSDISWRQKRAWVIETFTIDEGFDGPFPHYVGTINIDPNISNFEIHGPGVDKEPLNLLKIDNTAKIWIMYPVDREEYNNLKLVFQAYNKKVILNTRLAIDIIIDDTYDNEPKFGNQTYEVTIESTPLQGTALINVTAIDHDSTEENSKFSFSIESVTPTPQNFQFFINKEPDSGKGTISFKGCLDHEKAQKYTLIVKATDHGQPRPLSSSTTVIINIEDANRHLPVFTNEKSRASVKEGQEDVLISRLHVIDKDTKGTKAWKAKYKIQGDKSTNFRIVTDPDTNDGLLYVEKKLDYEDDPVKNINITSENEILYFICKVIDRNTAGLWKINTIIRSPFSVAQSGTRAEETSRLSTHHLTVTVEDVNEAPVFDPPNKTISVFEDVALGFYLETFTAKDPDIGAASTIRYIIGEDPAGCVTVDSRTGEITTSKSLDRESQFVKDGLYVVQIYAVDNGEPPQTGTATLSIKIMDVNDNAPSLDKNIIDMCQRDRISSVNVTALDPDEEPSSGPFLFKLLGDVKNKWRIDPEKGYSFKLVKEHNVSQNAMFLGHHKLQLEVSDLQGKTAVHSLLIYVCKCFKTTRPDCRLHKDTRSRLGSEALGILLLSMILLTGLLLLSFLISCKPKKVPFPDDNVEQYLMKSNTEEPGTDCELPLVFLQNKHNGQQTQTSQGMTLNLTPVLVKVNSQMSQNESFQEKPILGKRSSVKSMQEQWMILHGSSLTMKKRHQQQELKNVNRVWIQQSQHVHDILINDFLKTKLLTLEAQGKDLGNYEPVRYGDEGGSEHNFELDVLSIPGDPFDQDMVLDNRFLPLASICSPDITAQSTKTYFSKVWTQEN